MHNIDGVRKSALTTAADAPKQKASQFTTRPEISLADLNAVSLNAVSKITHNETISEPKHIALLGFFDYKQITTIAVTFVITFVISIATSQTLASYRNPSGLAAATEIIGSGKTENKLAVTDIPNIVDFNETVLNQPGEVFLPKENIQLPNPIKQRKEFLQKYLTEKGSALADHVDALSEQSQWKLIIAISRAESSFCKHKENYNCWGIGGAWNLKKYKSYDEAVSDVNRILEQHYIQSGLDTPGKIVKKYVGHKNDNWEYAVQQELDNLKNVE